MRRSSLEVPIGTLLAMAAGALAPAAGPLPEYAVIDLTALYPRMVSAHAINERGWVAGIASPGGPLRGCVWIEEAGFFELPPLAGGDLWSVARDINDRGLIVGKSHNASIDYRATLWDRGRPIDLGTVGAGDDDSDAMAINNLGDVVGESIDYEDPYFRAFVWSNGVITELPTLGGRGASADDINDDGWIVGTTNDGVQVSAVAWHDGAVHDLEVGVPPNSSNANEINDRGQIVGSYRGADIIYRHAFLWEDGDWIDIHGGPDWRSDYYDWNSSATAINNHGQIVGSSSDYWDDDAPPEAILWTAETGMRRLDDLIPPQSGWQLQLPDDINDAGQIAGRASRDGSGLYSRAFVMSPVHPTMALRASGGSIVAGEVNQLVVENATPGARVVFTYSLKGGGEFIPGCDLQVNALQLDKPKSLGHRRADANGVAKLRVFVPPAAQGQTVLVQAVVVEECAVSELMVEEVQ